MSETVTAEDIGWKGVLSFLETDEKSRRLLPFASLASKDEALKEFHPYTSHLALGFSSTKTYPFSKNFPFVTAREDGTFEVITPKRELLGRGTAEQALALVKAISSCRKDEDPNQPPKEPTASTHASTAARYVLGLANLENDIRRAYKVRGTVSRKLIFKALPDQKHNRIESLLKLRDEVIHGDEKAAGRITLRLLLEIGKLREAVTPPDHSARTTQKKRRDSNAKSAPPGKALKPV